MKFELSEEGKEYLEKGFPEKRLLELILENGNEITLEKARKLENLNIALQWCKKKGWIEIENGKIKITEKGIKEKDKPTEFEIALKKFSEGKGLEEEEIKLLLERKLIRKWLEVEIDEEIKEISPEIIKYNLWEGKRFKPYQVEVAGKIVYPGKKHPLRLTMEMVRETFLEMGFEEMEGPLVEIAFWNFDSMFVPQDHLAREMQDTFYLKGKGELPKAELVEKVEEVHEKNWDYKYSKEEAKRLVLRTHTTSVSFRKMAQGIKIPGKYFCIGRVFRNETIDYKHLPEFHQCEGIVLSKDANLRHLMGIIKEFYQRFGIEKVRFKYAYFPYTEPSLEAFGWHEKSKKWIELIGAGIFRPEALEPLGIKVPVLAWGLAIERLAMFIFGKEDIREIFGYTCDLQWLREFNPLKRKI